MEQPYPSPYHLQAEQHKDCSVNLRWSRPKMNFQKVYCKIEYANFDFQSDPEMKIENANGDWKSDLDMMLSGDQSEFRMSNTIPFKTYTFRVVYTSLDGKRQGLPSDETNLKIQIPVMDVDARINTDDKCIDFTWSQLFDGIWKIQRYVIQYTYDEYKTNKEEYADPSKLSLQIHEILPKKNYRFKAFYILCSCESQEENVNSELSKEQLIYTGEPAPPMKLSPVWKDGELHLFWLPPADTLFATDHYKIRVTKDEWATIDDDLQLANETLQCIVKNVKRSQMYRFKIYNCATPEICSKPVEEFFFTGVCYRIDIPIHQQYSEELNNKESEDHEKMYNVVKSTVEKVYQTVLPGLQRVRDVCFGKGSVIAVVILTSDGYHDEAILRETIEKPVKSGKLGGLKTFHKGFSFKVLNKPKPPQNISVVVENTCFVLTWTKPAKSLYEIEYYRIEYTSGEWQTKNVEKIPKDVFEFKTPEVLPSGNYKFRLFTSYDDSITSNASTEQEQIMIGPSPLNNLKVALVKSTKTGFKITWDNPVFPSEKHIEMYKLIVNGKERDLFKPDIECSCTWTPKPEEDCDVYTFAVIAYSVSGTESKSGEVTCNMLRAPVPPRNIKVENYPNGIQLIWDHAHTPKLHCIKHYTINIKDNGRQPLPPVIVHSPQKSQLISNLKPNNCYTFEVSTCSTENFEGLSSAPIESETGDTTVESH